jgi:ubiquitin-protein ligase
MTSSARGSNTFLSSLRVFADKISAKNMDAGRQNMVLKVIHELTRYFPAVRAVRILMDGKTLRPNECAAVVQSFAEVLGDLVPRNLIENDERRYLEGTRLLLGFVLQKMEFLSTTTPASCDDRIDDGLSYLNLFKTVDLRDVRTNEPVIDPVQTELGLMERGSFVAFKPGGILSHSSVENDDILQASPDPPALRAALLHGGVSPESSYYDADAIQASTSLTTAVSDLHKELRNFSRDLHHLGMLCHKTGMTVIHPTSLKSASAPVLTLDRDGQLCVYVGRAACAAPDRDISIFRPVNGTEEAIDVNIVAQLIDPIVRAREQDGTAVFDLFSKSLRSENAKPTELLMFCVDCSRSMNRGSDFQEIHEASIAPIIRESTLDDLPVTEEVDDPISLREMKDWLSDHESFEDMVAIVASADSYNKRAVAEEVVEFAGLLTSRELADKCKQLAEMRSWATRSFLSNYATSSNLRVRSLRRLLVGFNIYATTLCDFLLFKAQSWTEVKAFTWTYGGPIPHTDPGSSAANRLNVTDSFSIPPEIICPISQGVFEDPVTTSDNFTYERVSIERWFQIRRSSPLTGLPLEDLSLRRHQPLYDQTKRWLSGDDIMQTAPPPRKRSRAANSRSAADLNLNFVTPAGTFSRKVPSTLSLAGLYQLAYRGMRGVQKSFSLHLHGSLLESSDQKLESCRIASGSDIIASFHPALENVSLRQDSRPGGMCLVKVYKIFSKLVPSELFSYWIPQDTSHTMASILFRCWRFQLSTYRAFFDKDQQVWSGLKYRGDKVRTGCRHDHWDLLADSLNKLNFQKLVAAEKLYSDPSLDESDETEGQNTSGDESDTAQASAIPMKPTDRYRVLKVEISQYKSPDDIESERGEEMKRLTRLAVSKQVFGAFINRMIAYNYPTAIGLISIGTSASLAQPLTVVIENFRQAIDTLEASGDTALWDALALAADQLNHFGQKYPGIPKRIVCLSDGVDTNSVAVPNDVCRRLVRDKIAVDSCLIGIEDNVDLRTLSFLTGGYKFVPKTLEQAVAICELEPVLSIHERPPVVPPVIAPLLTAGSFTFAGTHAVPNAATRDDFPVRKPHPNLADQFVRINSIERRTRETNPQMGNATSTNKPTLRQRRIRTEIQHMADNPHPSYDVYVSESNMGFWKVVLSGPAESAYASGTFVLYLDMDDDYPQSPPQARFITRIFHPNINLGGRCCHSIFDRNYTVDITNKQVLDTVFGLLLVPEFTDPINTVVTLNFYWDEVAFREEVKKHIEKYALKGREELGKEILGE